MNLTPYKNTIKLLRIPFSFYLMPLFLLAVSQSTNLSTGSALLSFLIIHLLVYPASNGYNSYIDRDETPIGGLEKPPAPIIYLFYLTLAMDFMAILISYFLVSGSFSFCIVVYILASRAYSSKQIRLKKYPVAGFLTVVIFQGAFTYIMCSIGITLAPFEFNASNYILLCACSLQIAGAYPLTQIYQHRQDKLDGVTTLSYVLGYKGTFLFTAAMFALCNLMYYLYFSQVNKPNQFVVLQLFFVPIVAFFAYWFYRVLKNTSEADFKNTMRMNTIAALCMNSCFTLLYFLNS